VVNRKAFYQLRHGLQNASHRLSSVVPGRSGAARQRVVQGQTAGGEILTPFHQVGTNFGLFSRIQFSHERVLGASGVHQGGALLQHAVGLLNGNRQSAIVGQLRRRFLVGQGLDSLTELLQAVDDRCLLLPCGFVFRCHGSGMLDG